MDPETGKTRAFTGEICDTQCSYALGLEYGVIADRKRAEEHLLRKTRELHHTVGTGFFGTGLLNQDVYKRQTSHSAILFHGRYFP